MGIWGWTGDTYFKATLVPDRISFWTSLAISGVRRLRDPQLSRLPFLSQRPQAVP